VDDSNTERKYNLPVLWPVDAGGDPHGGSWRSPVTCSRRTRAIIRALERPASCSSQEIYAHATPVTMERTETDPFAHGGLLWRGFRQGWRDRLVECSTSRRNDRAMVIAIGGCASPPTHLGVRDPLFLSLTTGGGCQLPQLGYIQPDRRSTCRVWWERQRGETAPPELAARPIKWQGKANHGC